MSHFTVMVIGDNVDAQLAPFHEYECTGVMDQYVVWVDSTDEVLEHWARLSAEDKAEYKNVAGLAEDYYGYETRLNNGKVTYGRMTNPNAQWDWYQIGGRWSDMLKLKAGAKGTRGSRSLLDTDGRPQAGYCDSARKGDIDVEGMRDEAGEKAGKKWDIVNPVVGPHKSTFVSWEACQEAAKKDGVVDWEVARDAYHGQPLRKAVNAAADDKSNPNNRTFVWLDDVEKYLDSREEFVQRARDNALSTFAVVKDSTWVERGSMGWFGIVSDEKDTEQWARDFNKMFDELPDDTLITIVDCHV